MKIIFIFFLKIKIERESNRPEDLTRVKIEDMTGTDPVTTGGQLLTITERLAAVLWCH